MMKKHFTVWLCCLLAFMLLLNGCNEKDGAASDPQSSSTQATTVQSGTNEPNTESEDDGYVSIEEWVPIKDYGVDGGRREVTLLTLPTYNDYNLFFISEESPDALKTVAKKRTDYIAEQYNVAFNISDTSTDLLNLLQSSQFGNGGEYDLVFPHPTGGLLSMMSTGLLQNLCDFSNLHFDQPWWNQSQVKNYRIDDKLYIAASDFSLCGQGFVGLIYNRDIYNKLQLEYDLYDLVDDKQWTIAKLREICMLYGSDVNSDDFYDKQDTYGMIYQSQLAHREYWAMGGRIIDSDENGEHYLAIDADHTHSMAQALYNLLWNSDDHVWVAPSTYNATFPTSDGWLAYKAGQGLFMNFDLGGMYFHLNDLSFNIGYLPLPMLEEGQESYPVICASGFFAIPRKATDPEMSSILLEALSIYSYTNIRPAFFKTILLGRMSNVEEDYEMLEFLHESKIYDFGYTFSEGGSFMLLQKFVVEDKDLEIASYIRGHRKEMEKTLDHIESIRNSSFEE